MNASHRSGPALRIAVASSRLTLHLGGLLALVAYLVMAVTISASPTKQGKHDELAGGIQVVKG